jgi:diguanylate cyclase (GGDEF)-like protein/PAS domain S-box-containing protein
MLVKDSNYIERLRMELFKEAKEKGFSSNHTIQASQKLEKALNDFQIGEKSSLNFNEINEVINKEALMLITDINGVIVYINDNCGKNVGYTPEELIGKHTRIFKTGIHTAEFYQNLWNTLLLGKSWKGELTARRKDGSIVWNFLTIYPIFDENHQPYQFLTLRTDITDLKEMEEKALIKDKQLQSHFDILKNAVTGSMDETGTIQYLSPSVEKVLGYKASERVGSSIFDYIENENLSEFKKSLDELKKTPDGTMSIEVSYRCKSGKTTLCEFTAKNYLHDPVLHSIVFTGHDVSLQKHFDQRLENILYNDELTGLPNFKCFEEQLVQEIEIAMENNKNLVVIQLGLDDFKLVNSTFSHCKGDHLLKEFVSRFKPLLSKKISMYRMSGDIFILLMKGNFDVEKIQQTLNNILTLISKDPFHIEENEIFITASMGVSIFPFSGENKDSLLKNAEIAMNRAQKSGKNQYQIFSPTMNLYSFKQYMLRNDSKKALLNDEFCIYYQPRINPIKNEMVSAEALIRWEHPKWGLVLPDEFISMAEDSGLIVPIGEWLIKKVCSQLKKWEEDNFLVKKISINLSSLQLLQPNFVDMVSSILRNANVNPKWIEFEITESVIIEKEEQVLRTLNQLKNIGITLALDDFGTGYSSLNYLKKFPCEIVKIDKSLINDIHYDKDNHEIIASIIALCHKLKKTVVAEGVEKKEQLSILRRLRCDQIQGYLFSKPVNEQEYQGFLKEGKRFSGAKEGVDSNYNRRKYIRIPLDTPLVADMTIERVAGRKVSLGSSEVMIRNISSGGLCFYSPLKMPISKEIILMFTPEISSKILNLKGHIVWKEEKQSNYFEYGVEFLLSKLEQEYLSRVLDSFHPLIKERPILTGSRFYKA